MEPWRLSVHPVYGAIYRDGEFVQRGSILGLNTQATGVVVAPASGWVKIARPPLPKEAAREAAESGGEETLPEEPEPARVDYIAIEIWPQART